MASGIESETGKSPKTQEKDTGSNHVVPVMLTFYDSDLKTVKEGSRSKFRGCVVSDLVGGSFRPIFRVSHFGRYVRDFMLSLSDNYQADIIEAFNST